MVGERLGRAGVRRHNRFLVTSRHLTGGSADDLGADEDFDPDFDNLVEHFFIHK